MTGVVLAPGYVRKGHLVIIDKIAPECLYSVQPQLSLNLNCRAVYTSRYNGDLIKQTHRERKLRAKPRTQPTCTKFVANIQGSTRSHTPQHCEQRVTHSHNHRRNAQWFITTTKSNHRQPIEKLMIFLVRLIEIQYSYSKHAKNHQWMSTS